MHHQFQYKQELSLKDQPSMKVHVASCGVFESNYREVIQSYLGTVTDLFVCPSVCTNREPKQSEIKESSSPVKVFEIGRSLGRDIHCM